MKVSADHEQDTLVERMRRRDRTKPESDRIVPVTFCIDRKINLQHTANQALTSFLARTDAMNNPAKVKKYYKVKSLDEMGVTYFGTLDFVAAIERQGKRGLFDNFGRDEKRTRDAVTRLKGSFLEYMRDSRIVASVMAESPSLEPLLADPYDSYDWEREREFCLLEPDMPEMSKWEETAVDVGRNVLTLQGDHYIYMALDLSANPFLTEERNGIRSHFKTEFGLTLLDRERWQDGKPIRHIMHSTFARVPEQVFFDQPPIITEPPLRMAFMEPRIDAHANVGK